MLNKQTEKELKEHIREDGLLGISKYGEEDLREWLLKIEVRIRDEERTRIIKHITTYDLIPPQVKLESPRYWDGYRDTVDIIVKELSHHAK